MFMSAASKHKPSAHGIVAAILPRQVGFRIRLMEDLSVAETAECLGISARRVRALLKEGQLQGRQVAGRWLVSFDHVEHRLLNAPRPGRPWSAASAWHVLAVLSRADDALKEMSPSTRSRARTRATQLRRLPHGEVARIWSTALRGRARTLEFYVHMSVSTAVLADSRIVPSGISAASHHAADLMVTGGAEGYVRAGQLAPVSAEYALIPESAAHANLRLHVVDASEANWLFGRDSAPLPVVAVDLMDRNGPREQKAGTKLVTAT
jgi:hypothetical protein